MNAATCTFPRSFLHLAPNTTGMRLNRRANKLLDTRETECHVRPNACVYPTGDTREPHTVRGSATQVTGMRLTARSAKHTRDTDCVKLVTPKGRMTESEMMDRNTINDN